MKTKILILLIIVTSLFGYLEWGKNNSSFLYAGEFEVFKKLFTDPGSIVNPFIIAPLIGQILLLVTLFQRLPNKYLTYSGIACLSLLLGLMTFIGIIDLNFKILISSLPFIITSFLSIRELRRLKNQMLLQ